MNGIKIRPEQMAPSFPMAPPNPIKEANTDNFGDLLKNAIDSVENMQADAAEAQDKFIHGEATELHQVMIAAEKAGLSFDLLLEIRQRLVDAFQDLMRMPV